MKPASTAGNNLNAAVPIASMFTTNEGALEKSGPLFVMGASAMENAIKMPPHAIKGITYETPVNRYCLCFCNTSFMPYIYGCQRAMLESKALCVRSALGEIVKM